jgi:cysteate synthase
MYDAWKAGSKTLLPMNDEEARIKATAIDAKVLSNRRPPYAVRGGLYDAMCDAGGDVELADNDDIKEMQALFLRTEGIDIHPASAVATKGMINAFNAGKMPKDAIIMLNITGGGEERFKRDHKVVYLKPSLIALASDEGVITRVENLFK